MKKIRWWSALLVLVAASLLLWRELRPLPPIPVGVVAWLASAAVIGSSEMNAADLFVEEHPHSRIQVRPVDDQWQPQRTVRAIAAAMGEGVRFFVSTHPSKCAVASIQLFADSRALLVNTASTSPALTGKDDYFFRIVADADQEQRAIARYVDQLPGARILVLQDEGNPAYTGPAFQAFSTELESRHRWHIVQRPLMVASFKPDELQSIMAEPYDALYILAGSFQAAIGNVAQLFHHLHPTVPILLTPWARSPAILETAGPAIDRIILPSQYPPRHDAPVIDAYFRRFQARYGYAPHAMTIGVWQALELFDQAFTRGYDTPAKVKQYLLSTPIHQTSLGPITFDAKGDVSQTFYFIQDLKKELE
jgi:branched-chain amino acid transport system substrate-binding protein